MTRTPPDDDLFQAIHAVRGTPLQAGEPRLRALLEQALSQGQRWHAAYAQAVLAPRVQGGTVPSALELAQASLATYEALGCKWGQATALSAIGGALLHSGHLPEALEHGQASIRLARRVGDASLLARCIANVSGTLARTGQDDLAVDLAEEGLRECPPDALSVRRALTNTLGTCLVRLAHARRRRGEMRDQWLPLVERAHEQLEQSVPGQLLLNGPLPPNAYSWGCKAAALIGLGRHPEGRAIFDQLEPHYRALDDRVALRYVHLHRAWSHLDQGESEAALAHAQAYRAIIRDENTPSLLHPGLEIEALALEQAGRYREALAAFKEYHHVYCEGVQEHAETQARGMAVALKTEQALREAQEDALTSLPNRRAFDRALAAAAADRSGTAHSVVLIDVDHFKAINDHFGHAAGDEALTGLARLMRDHCRAQDHPARLGGDEFAVLVQGPVGAAEALAGRIAQALRLWRSSLPDMPTPTLSIGIAEKPTGIGVTVADWLAAADQALYAAKDAGRDTVRTAGCTARG